MFGSITVAYDDVTGNRTVTNALGKSGIYKYTMFNAGAQNSARRLTQIDGQPSTNCPASSVATTYTAQGLRDTTTDEEGRVTKYTYDTRGLVASLTRGYGTPQAVTTSFTNHATLRVPTQMVEPGKTTNYTWDAATGRLTSLSQVDTTTQTIPYSTNGQTRTWAYTYTTAAGLLATVDGPLAGAGDKVTYTYDANGYVATVTNEVGHVTTVNTVNGRGQPTQITDPNSVVSNLTYDFQGRLKTVTVNPGASQAVTSLDYDSIGNITKVTRPDGSFFTYTYNNARRLTTVTSNTGETITYTYDLMGGVTSRVIKNSGGTIVFNQTQTFDELGRLLKHIGANATAPQTTTYAYEKNGNLKSVTDPRSGLYQYGYDSLNRLISETDQESAVVGYSPTNRLTTSYFAPWGQNTYTYDAVGNRKTDVYTNPSSVVTTRNYSYNAAANKISKVVIGTTNERTFVHDNAGNISQDTRSGVVYDYSYNKRNRLKTVTVGGVLKSTYTYNGLEQVTIRALTNMTPSGTTHFIYDRQGNLIAETAGGGATGTTGTVREYIYLPETEISPTFGSRTVVDRPLAVVNAVNTTPVLWHVHTDHLNRPVRMTDSAQAVVWNAQWLPWGNVFAITGTANLDARFPGQWFQLESGLHYNWYRHYDPTLGRFTQADPLGFVDGPSVYGYGRSSPHRFVDPDGLIAVADDLAIGAGVIVVGCALTPDCRQAVYDICMMALRGRRQNIENEYSRAARQQPDPCDYLRRLHESVTDKAEKRKIKTAQKVLGCRRTGSLD